MRLLVLAPNFYVDTVPPPGLDIHQYAKVTGGVATGSTVVSSGYGALDIWSCLLARASQWTATVSGSYLNSDETASFAGTVVMESGVWDSIATTTPYPVQLGYSAHPEATLTTLLHMSAAIGEAADQGTWDSTAFPATSFNYSAFADFRPAGAFGGRNWAGPRFVGNDLYIPFNFQLHMDIIGAGAGFNFSTIPATLDGVVTAIEVGTLTIEVPSWTGPGTNVLSLPLWGLDTTFSGTCSLNIVLTPTQHFSYDGIWNPDGTANSNPLD